MEYLVAIPWLWRALLNDSTEDWNLTESSVVFLSMSWEFRWVWTRDDKRMMCSVQFYQYHITVERTVKVPISLNILTVKYWLPFWKQSVCTTLLWPSPCVQTQSSYYLPDLFSLSRNDLNKSLLGLARICIAVQNHWSDNPTILVLVHYGRVTRSHLATSVNQHAVPSIRGRGYCGGSPTAVQAWQPCPLWEPSPKRGSSSPAHWPLSP